MTTHAKHFLDRNFAFRRGQKAFRDGDPQSANPYERAPNNAAESIAADNWIDGYIWQSHGCPGNVSPDALIRAKTQK